MKSNQRVELINLESEIMNHQKKHVWGHSATSEILVLTLKYAELCWENKSIIPIPVGDRKSSLELAVHPVFICGVHRSGTTFIRNLLDGHSDLTVLPFEATYLTTFQKYTSKHNYDEAIRLLALEWIQRFIGRTTSAFMLGRTTEDMAPYVEFVSWFVGFLRLLDVSDSTSRPFSPLISLALAYQRMQSSNNKISKWVDKTPTNEINVEYLVSNFPEGKFLHIVRNPVSILASRLKMDRLRDPTATVNTEILEPIRNTFELAKKNQMKFGQDRYMVIKYEELVTSTKKVMNLVADFLEILYEPSLVVPKFMGRETGANSSFKLSKKSKNKFNPGTTRRDYLSSQDIELLSSYLHDSALVFGYDFESNPENEK